MTKDIRDVSLQFDALIAQAQSADTKALIAAMRLQTEFWDLRLAQAEANAAMQRDRRGFVFGE